MLRYDLFKTMMLRNPIPVIDYQLQDGLLLHAISSVLAGTVATSESNYVLRQKILT